MNNFFPKALIFSILGIFLAVAIGFVIQNEGNINVKNQDSDTELTSLKEVVLDNKDYEFYGTTVSEGMIIITNGKDSDERRFGFANTQGEVVIEYRGSYFK